MARPSEPIGLSDRDQQSSGGRYHRPPKLISNASHLVAIAPPPLDLTS
jgi:hypothetical protein